MHIVRQQTNLSLFGLLSFLAGCFVAGRLMGLACWAMQQ